MQKTTLLSHRFKDLHPPSPFAAKPRVEAPISVLVVEDEAITRKFIHRCLEKAGFLVREVADGEEAIAAFEQEPPQVVILDIMLPGMDGFEVCRRFRESRDDTAILMLTAKKEDESKIYGLELGADDYMVKPFNPGELVARIKAVLRRQDSRMGAAFSLKYKNLRIDFRTQKAFNGVSEIDLTPQEFSLLATFLENPGRILTREELTESLWGKGHHGSSKSLDVCVRKLREKTEDDPSHPTRLKTARGFGYICE
ncbi:MAG: response regulator transcription factor [Holophaga sp.]|nr:response regulator transcription factor [Holophaga sp.]